MILTQDEEEDEVGELDTAEEEATNPEVSLNSVVGLSNPKP